MKTILNLLLLSILMVSQSIPQNSKQSLDGEWLFKVDSTKAGLNGKWFAASLDRSGWEKVETPRFWEGYPGLATYDGWGWFAKTITVNTIPGPMSLHFAGVDDDAVVWINGVEVGSHTGYTDPFAVDASSALHAGQNLVVVLVKDYGGGGGIYKPITLVETKYLDDLLKSPYFGTPARKSADWVRDAVIYSVYLRSFSKEGNFAGLEKRVPELKDLGATVIWLLPINPVGVKNRKGTLGSPYAVRDYYGINPEFGTMKDFKKLLATVHKNGMRLIIDLVANHTSWDSKLIIEHPEWFTKDSTGRIIPPNADWTDVADLNYDRAGLRRYMITMMKWWVKDIGIDGFRCDVAEMVPTDFWNDARSELDKIKPVMLLSEGSIPEHHAYAFDLTYAWNIYDALPVLMQGKRPLTLLDELLKNERLQFPIGSLRMRFTTNHDKNAWESPAVTRLGLDGLKLSTVLVNTIPGVPMIYTGEEVANDKKLDLFEKVDVDWSRSREEGDVYSKLFHLRKSNKALSRGEMIRLTTDADTAVYAFARVAGNDRIIVLLNFRPEQRVVTVNIPAGVVGDGKKVVTNELFSGDTATISGGNKDGLHVALPANGYKVFVLR